MTDWVEQQTTRVQDLCQRAGLAYSEYEAHPHLLVLPMHNLVALRQAAGETEELAADLVAWLTDHLCRAHPVSIVFTPDRGVPVLVHHESGISPEALVRSEMAEPPVLPQRILAIAEEMLELTVKDCGC